MTPDQAYEWLAPKLSTAERSVLNVIYKAVTKQSAVKPEKWGCHCDLDVGESPDFCVLGIGRPQDCSYAERLLREGKGRNDCEWWRIIEV